MDSEMCVIILILCYQDKIKDIQQALKRNTLFEVLNMLVFGFVLDFFMESFILVHMVFINLSNQTYY